MYENGVRINRYKRKCMHKHRLKKQFAQKDGMSDWNSMLCYNEGVWDPLDEDEFSYWRLRYRSGSRKFAKMETNRRLRSMSKIPVTMMDYEDVESAMRGGQYGKIFDYGNTVY